MRLKPAFDSTTKQEEIYHVTRVFNSLYSSMLQITQSYNNLCLCFHWILYCNVQILSKTSKSMKINYIQNA